MPERRLRIVANAPVILNGVKDLVEAGRFALRRRTLSLSLSLRQVVCALGLM
ncbi:hypothetical protein [Gracilimonas sp. BCB1]|uniref:hypothetical protein n=1 Tax=Gracilimonas sp. BCB1 TaxID=3152362 RepID=UPI0032D8FE7F